MLFRGNLNVHGFKSKQGNLIKSVWIIVDILQEISTDLVSASASAFSLLGPAGPSRPRQLSCQL